MHETNANSALTARAWNSNGSMMGYLRWTIATVNALAQKTQTEYSAHTYMSNGSKGNW